MAYAKTVDAWMPWIPSDRVSWTKFGTLSETRDLLTCLQNNSFLPHLTITDNIHSTIYLQKFLLDSPCLLLTSLSVHSIGDSILKTTRTISFGYLTIVEFKSVHSQISFVHILSILDLLKRHELNCPALAGFGFNNYYDEVRANWYVAISLGCSFGRSFKIANVMTF